jgi:glycosyltransferase involved in cell wall biosynthesis
MRVLYSFPDEIGRTGIGTTAFNQVREVATQGVDVILYCTSRRGDLPDNVRVVQTLSVAGRRIPHRALGINQSYAYHDRRVASALRRLRSTIDAVHCWPRATVHTARTARRLGVPCFREVPNTHTGHAYDVVSREVAALGLTAPRGHSHTFDPKILALEELEYDLAHILLVPSEYARATFVERGVPERKLRLHRYGCDLRRFFAHPSNACGEPKRPFTAIFVGRCEPRKGLHHALRAWHDSGAARAGGRFLICGSFEARYREALAPLLAHPSIVVEGFVSDPAALMRESDVFVLPSVEEGSALVTYEAKASGCVLLVSQAAGARCTDGVDALVHVPGDVVTLTAHLTRVREDRRFLRRLRSAALARTADLSWAAAGAELATIYHEGSAATAGA